MLYFPTYTVAFLAVDLSMPENKTELQILALEMMFDFALKPDRLEFPGGTD